MPGTHVRVSSIARRAQRLGIVIVLGTTSVAAITAGASTVHTLGARKAAVPTVRDDFNGDGHADLAAGVPLEDVNGVLDAGAVNVIYGSAQGLAAAGNQLWNQRVAAVGGEPQREAEFGSALASGDLNGDGYADLAIGVPLRDSPEDSGEVIVLYGSASGLGTAGSQALRQGVGGIHGIAQAHDEFGWTLAAGDFNHDGFDDLAVGTPLDPVNGHAQAGSVNVIYGSPTGLVSTGNQWWTQDSPGIINASEPGDLFGFSLASGDFDHDGFRDLAIGVPGEDPPTDGGSVAVLYGAAGGLASARSQLWSQDSPGILDQGENYDKFGYALAAGDLNGDGHDDLAVGVPFEDVGSIPDAGGVNVLYGSSGGLAATGNQFWTQNSPGVINASEPSDEFGFALAVGDFNGDGHADLAVGVPGEDPPTNGGGINVLYGSAAGITAAGNQIWSQDSAGVLDGESPGDMLGFTVSAANFGRGRPDDLVMGVPFEDLGGAIDAGAVNVVYGTTTGLLSAGNQFWNQDSPGISGTAGDGDEFSFAAA